jgi:hypothetical protein
MIECEAGLCTARRISSRNLWIQTPFSQQKRHIWFPALTDEYSDTVGIPEIRSHHNCPLGRPASYCAMVDTLDVRAARTSHLRTYHLMPASRAFTAVSMCRDGGATWHG